jgi:NAD(P)-dependent dehydrogenase (short-subunit alcohol dehydrogenase family)
MAAGLGTALRSDALEGRTAVVTAGTSGIGLAAAQALAAAGARTILVSRDETRLRAAQEVVPRSAVVAADLSTVLGVDHLVSTVLDAGEVVDVLVNAAGGGNFTSAVDISPEDVAESFDLNVRSTILLSSRFGSGMVQRGRGSIINVSSIAADAGSGQLTLYSSAKSAVNGFTRALSAEWGRSGVRVNCVMPGLTRTARNVGMFENPLIMDEFNYRCDLGRPADPAEIGRVIAFLATDDASYITGQCLAVDGGSITAHHGYTKLAAGLSQS